MFNLVSVIAVIISLNILAQPYNFDGIVKLSNCSGSLIKFEKQLPSSKALVMTNGHCISLPVALSGFQSIAMTEHAVLEHAAKGLFELTRMLEPGEIIYNTLHSRSMHVFNADMDLIPINVKKILYATMTDTDLAIYEIDSTYDELEAQGVTALTLSSQRPVKGTAIQIISGYWDRGYQCKIDEFIHKLLEAEWTFSDAIRYSATGCETIGGTSGSPVVHLGKRLVVGINNTSNQDGLRCKINNPCEVDAQNNVLVMPKRSYGQQTYTVYSCLNSQGKIDLAKEGCLLPKGVKAPARNSGFQTSRT